MTRVERNGAGAGGGGRRSRSRTGPVREVDDELGARSGYGEVRRQVRGRGASGRLRQALSCRSELGQSDLSKLEFCPKV